MFANSRWKEIQLSDVECFKDATLSFGHTLGDEMNLRMFSGAAFKSLVCHDGLELFFGDTVRRMMFNEYCKNNCRPDNVMEVMSTLARRELTYHRSKLVIIERRELEDWLQRIRECRYDKDCDRVLSRFYVFGRPEIHAEARKVTVYLRTIVTNVIIKDTTDTRLLFATEALDAVEVLLDLQDKIKSCRYYEKRSTYACANHLETMTLSEFEAILEEYDLDKSRITLVFDWRYTETFLQNLTNGSLALPTLNSLRKEVLHKSQAQLQIFLSVVCETDWNARGLETMRGGYRNQVITSMKKFDTETFVLGSTVATCIHQLKSATYFYETHNQKRNFPTTFMKLNTCGFLMPLTLFVTECEKNHLALKFPPYIKKEKLQGKYIPVWKARLIFWLEYCDKFFGAADQGLKDSIRKAIMFKVTLVEWESEEDFLDVILSRKELNLEQVNALLKKNATIHSDEIEPNWIVRTQDRTRKVIDAEKRSLDILEAIFKFSNKYLSREELETPSNHPPKVHNPTRVLREAPQESQSLLESVQQLFVNKENELLGSQSRIEALERELQMCKRSQEENRNLRVQVQKLEEQNDILATENEVHNESLQDLKKKHVIALTKLYQDKEKLASELKEQSERIRSMHQDHELQLANIQKANQEALQKMTAEHNQRIAELRLEKEQNEEQLKEQNERQRLEMEETIRLLNEEGENITKSFEESQLQVALLTSQMEVANGEIAKLNKLVLEEKRANKRLNITYSQLAMLNAEKDLTILNLRQQLANGDDHSAPFDLEESEELSQEIKDMLEELEEKLATIRNEDLLKEATEKAKKLEKLSNNEVIKQLARDSLVMFNSEVSNYKETVLRNILLIKSNPLVDHSDLTPLPDFPTLNPTFQMEYDNAMEANESLGRECLICREQKLPGQDLSHCRHCPSSYHFACAENWRSVNPTCPVCKKSF